MATAETSGGSSPVGAIGTVSQGRCLGELLAYPSSSPLFKKDLHVTSPARMIGGAAGRQLDARP